MTLLERIKEASAWRRRHKGEMQAVALNREIDSIYADAAKLKTPEEALAILAFIELCEEGDIDLSILLVRRAYKRALTVLAAQQKKAA